LVIENPCFAYILQVLFGDVNPSAKLPFTIHRKREEYAADVVYSSWWDWLIQRPVQIDYKEGLFIDHMHADAKGIEPLFPFGFGLSYTEFEIVDLEINSTATRPVINVSGGDAVNVTVSVEVWNIGRATGSEVVQLYIAFPKEAEEPPQLLRGFEKVSIEPGKSSKVEFKLGFDSFRMWQKWGGNDADAERLKGTGGKWVIVPGEYEIRVGQYSRDPKMVKGVVQFS
jgi:beta-glucosidase